MTYRQTQRSGENSTVAHITTGGSSGWLTPLTRPVSQTFSQQQLMPSFAGRSGGDGPYAASRMPFEEAERIIRARAEEYVETAGRDAMP